MRASIRFTLNGQRHELSREDVEIRLADVAPDAIRKHAVRVNGTWFPVIQAFEIATGIPRSEFMSNSARRHLAALGYEIAGDVEARTQPPAIRSAFTPSAAAAPPRDLEQPTELAGEWHTEANVQASLVTALAADGWRILSVANTATKEHGIDVIASRDGQTVGVEVKGFPSRGHADPARAGEVKRTSPSTQAGHWYSQAVLAAMRLRGKEPIWRSVIALPDFPRYRDLHTETAGSLAAAQIEVWWVDQERVMVAIGERDAAVTETEKRAGEARGSWPRSRACPWARPWSGSVRPCRCARRRGCGDSQVSPKPTTVASGRRAERRRRAAGDHWEWGSEYR